MSEEVKFDMENIWFQLLSQMKIEEIKDEKIKEKTILLTIHKFLLYLAGQRFYLLKKWIRYLKHILCRNAKILKQIGILNKEIEATRNKKQKDIKIIEIETMKAGLVYDKKINMGFLMNFLINKNNQERLAIGSLDGASSEITNVSFWQRLDIFNIERSGVMFPYYVEEDTVDKIYSATDTSELSDTETLLFELYYMGYIELNLSEEDEDEDEDREEYMFTWVNYIKCNLLLLRLKDYKTKSVKFGCYNGDEVKNIKEMFELEYWRDILKKKITQFAEIAFKEEINRLQVENIEKQKILNSSKIKITNDMKNTEKEKEIIKLKIDRTNLYENTFKHQLKECLVNFLRNELLGCLNEHDRTKSRLDDLIKVETEESFLKVPDLISQNFNARIDVVVYINLSDEVGDRLIVLFELKKEEPRLKDLKIFTDSNKHYDKIKFKEGSRVIYVAGSISEFKDKGKNLQPYKNGPKASFFADTEFKPYRDRVEEDEQERENDQTNRRK
eukprot:GAHX01001325.1.p1 GENE.GAHX01001325.1~~GAHX01001325.1.p1  ORF type:complete len:501 (-),score=105.87 GAHX01001325.1:49-1551(-)